jgi:hypothetical protein
MDWTASAGTGLAEGMLMTMGAMLRRPDATDSCVDLGIDGRRIHLLST